MNTYFQFGGIVILKIIFFLAFSQIYPEPLHQLDEAAFFSFVIETMKDENFTASSLSTPEWSLGYIACAVFNMFDVYPDLFHLRLFSFFGSIIKLILFYKLLRIFNVRKKIIFIGLIIAGFFPIFFLQDYIFNREIWIQNVVLSFFLFSALFLENPNLRNLFFMALFSVIPIFLHNGVAFGCWMAMFSYVFVVAKRQAGANSYWLIVLLLCGFLGLLPSYIDFEAMLFNLEPYVVSGILVRDVGRLGYSLSIMTLSELVLSIPLLFFYFLFGFKLSLITVDYLIVSTSIFFFLMCFGIVWCSLQLSRMSVKNYLTKAKILALILIGVTLILMPYVLGSYNFGTAFRHKMKFAPIFLVCLLVLYEFVVDCRNVDRSKARM